jgi:hypothetical protein
MVGVGGPVLFVGVASDWLVLLGCSEVAEGLDSVALDEDSDDDAEGLGSVALDDDADNDAEVEEGTKNVGLTTNVDIDVAEKVTTISE